MPVDEEQPRRAANGAQSSETTPLLNGDSGVRGIAATAAAANDEETTVIAETVSNGRLALILGTSYFGVFLGAIDSTVSRSPHFHIVGSAAAGSLTKPFP